MNKKYSLQNVGHLVSVSVFNIKPFQPRKLLFRIAIVVRKCRVCRCREEIPCGYQTFSLGMFFKLLFLAVTHLMMSSGAPLLNHIPPSLLWLVTGGFYPFHSGLRHWHLGIVPMPVRQSWRIWENAS